MGVALLAPTGNFLPTVLIAIMGPYPMSYGNDGRTTLDDTLEMGAAYGAASFVFIPDLISEEDKTSGIKGSRLVGHTAMRNMGIKMALENGYDYLFLVENDVKFRPETLNRLPGNTAIEFQNIGTVESVAATTEYSLIFLTISR